MVIFFPTLESFSYQLEATALVHLQIAATLKVSVTRIQKFSTMLIIKIWRVVLRCVTDVPVKIASFGQETSTPLSLIISCPEFSFSSTNTSKASSSCRKKYFFEPTQTDCHLLNSGKQIHTQVIKFGLDLDLYVINSLIRYYGACGDMSDARKLFEEVPVRNFIIRTMIVSGYARNFFSNEALLLFDQMLAKGVEPNGETLLPVLCACARSLSLKSEQQTEVGLMLGTALVDIYAQRGEISVARSLFHKIPERNTTTWNAMICGLADLGHAVEALELFKEMGKEKVMPDDITCRAGLLEDGRDIFLSMKQVHENEPKIEHHRCMVDLLVQGGRLLEAEELISGMVCEADIVVLGALLDACKNHGNIAIAERVVKKMLHLEPQNHGVYDVLSSMYAGVGRWEDELKLRKKMKASTKIPGWGFMDTWMDLARKHIL
ncbi:pentatricopeptide repeat-containing protein At5g56310-like [Papaver somniferum]|uniref:pentatricopeptide repeat-containing protein At5g56310-like n=1 Tax=Papaver somniferum TaxID=3469 RepID=UPI000E6FB6CD|nr:pentatricopeptide repeat-containing protein At5g56310-like [Papaver somniferum]